MSARKVGVGGREVNAANGCYGESLESPVKLTDIYIMSTVIAATREQHQHCFCLCLSESLALFKAKLLFFVKKFPQKDG